jgi:hypothetical protein
MRPIRGENYFYLLQSFDLNMTYHRFPWTTSILMVLRELLPSSKFPLPSTLLIRLTEGPFSSTRVLYFIYSAILGNLIITTGGPGGSGVDFLLDPNTRGLGQLVVGPEHDIIGLDPR